MQLLPLCLAGFAGADADADADARRGRGAVEERRLRGMDAGGAKSSKSGEKTHSCSFSQKPAPRIRRHRSGETAAGEGIGRGSEDGLPLPALLCCSARMGLGSVRSRRRRRRRFGPGRFFVLSWRGFSGGPRLMLIGNTVKNTAKTLFSYFAVRSPDSGSRYNIREGT